MNSRVSWFWLGFVMGGGDDDGGNSAGGFLGLLIVFAGYFFVQEKVIPFLLANFSTFLIIYICAFVLTLIAGYIFNSDLTSVISNIILAISATVFFLSVYVRLETTGLLSTLVNMLNSTLDWQAGFWVALGKSLLYLIYLAATFTDWFIVPTLLTMGVLWVASFLVEFALGLVNIKGVFYRQASTSQDNKRQSAQNIDPVKEKYLTWRDKIYFYGNTIGVEHEKLNTFEAFAGFENLFGKLFTSNYIKADDFVLTTAYWLHQNSCSHCMKDVEGFIGASMKVYTKLMSMVNIGSVHPDLLQDSGILSTELIEHLSDEEWISTQYIDSLTCLEWKRLNECADSNEGQ